MIFSTKRVAENPRQKMGNVLPDFPLTTNLEGRKFPYLQIGLW
jgi:hypothetical protein